MTHFLPLSWSRFAMALMVTRYSRLPARLLTTLICVWTGAAALAVAGLVVDLAADDVAWWAVALNLAALSFDVLMASFAVRAVLLNRRRLITEDGLRRGALYYDMKGRPVSRDEWSELFNDSRRQLAATTLADGDVSVSTVWMGLDVGMGDRALIFETMVFGGPNDGGQLRYDNAPEALVGHEWAVRATRAALAGK